MHNHPSGDPTPSKADIEVTLDIVRAAKPLGVTIHDHLIIGRGRHTSLRDLGLLGGSLSHHSSIIHQQSIDGMPTLR